MPQPDDSGGPSHPCHFSDASVSASVYVKTLADLNLHFEAVPTLRVCGYPYGLQDSLCTLHLSCSQDSTHSATDATLDTGGWLNLSGQGLAPCKVHQASLGALTTKPSGGAAVQLGRLVMFHHVNVDTGMIDQSYQAQHATIQKLFLYWDLFVPI